ncbi:hypothetical protein K0I63_13745 [Shewanella rhizosphaerae]|uniref:hypothetical protein n=1 Tax=Shewanella rhizosphaerae TaxID=2864207 RepID=UPI001C65F654|nr:hypothetical protein [Shewanella rhizosphaerae]QYK11824.1 hypothetical protein K0I63_13745 [Shewanella rhizosphaerae]
MLAASLCLWAAVLSLGALSSRGSQAAPIPGVTPEQPWQVKGYVSYLGSVVDPAEGEQLWDSLLHNRIDAEYRWQSLRVNVGLRNRLMVGDSGRLPGYGELLAWDPGYWDLSANWLDSDGWIGNSQLDRAYLSWQFADNWELVAGRFRVNWAMSTLWNPNDIFNAYSIYDVDYAERRGVDALKLSRQLGYASQLEFVYSQEADSAINDVSIGRKNRQYAGRYLGHNFFGYDFGDDLGWDWQLILGKTRDDRVFGGGFAGDIWGAGLRGELTHFDPINTSYVAPVDAEPRTTQSLASATQVLEASTVATLEMDYSFASDANWRVLGAALYISSPLSVDSALLYLNLPLSARTLSFTTWTYYLDLGFDLTPLSRLSANASYYDDDSFFVGLTYQYSLADDWQLSLIAQRFDGSSASLFGQSASTLGYLQLKWSF